MTKEERHNKIKEMVKERLEVDFHGNEDAFLKNIRLKEIMFLVFSGFAGVIAMMVYNSTGEIMWFTSIISGTFFIFALLANHVHRKTRKILDEISVE